MNVFLAHRGSTPMSLYHLCLGPHQLPAVSRWHFYLLLLLLGCKALPPFEEDEHDTSEHTDSTEFADETALTCEGNRCVVSGTLTDDGQWTRNNTYILNGMVHIGNGNSNTRLTIESGTRILGMSESFSMLIVEQNAKLYAEGTKEDPIVFSSENPSKERRRGDWGGIVINGNAPVNGCSNHTPCDYLKDEKMGTWGGDDDSDNSGTMKYVRIEYAGKGIDSKSPGGGLTLRGVGANTTLDRIHLHLNENNGITVVGGTVDLKYILSTGSSGNGLFWTDGWTGRAQYIISQQYDDAGQNGLMGENHKDTFDTFPISYPILSNVTLVGVPDPTHSGTGLMLQGGTKGEIHNAVVVGFGSACIDINTPATWENSEKGTLSIQDSTIDCSPPFAENAPDMDPEGNDVSALFYKDSGNHIADPQLTSPFSRNAPDFAPKEGSAAIDSGNAPTDNFFDGVRYQGGCDPADDWTKEAWIQTGLSESSASIHAENSDDNMENALVCTGDVCIANGTFTSDMHWTKDKLYILRGGVFIGDGDSPTRLTIDPGTQIIGESTTTGFLVIQRNAFIDATGTPTMPIVFTSDKPVGSRKRGDWGGVVINGNAPINGCSQSVCERWGEGGTGWYGGNTPDDTSGTLEYVRIEFAGKQLGPDNELNGLALQGVGSNTKISHLHLHMNKDDAIEFFGGYASATYIFATGTGDDNLDWTEGWRGRIQFFVAQQYFDAGDNGIEADNNHDDNTSTPISNPTVANFTLVGNMEGDHSDIGVLLREGTNGTLVNGIVMGFNDACMDVDHLQTWQNIENGGLSVHHTLIDCDTPFKANYTETDPDEADLASFFGSGKNNRRVSPELDDPFERETPRLAPVTGGISATGAAVLDDPFFTQVEFLGGVSPEEDWIANGIVDGWIEIKGL